MARKKSKLKKLRETKKEMDTAIDFCMPSSEVQEKLSSYENQLKSILSAETEHASNINKYSNAEDEEKEKKYELIQSLQQLVTSNDFSVERLAWLVIKDNMLVELSNFNNLSAVLDVVTEGYHIAG